MRQAAERKADSEYKKHLRRARRRRYRPVPDIRQNKKRQERTARPDRGIRRLVRCEALIYLQVPASYFLVVVLLVVYLILVLAGQLCIIEGVIRGLLDLQVLPLHII